MSKKDGALELTKKIHDNVLNVILEKEREIDEIIDEYAAIEKRLSRQEDGDEVLQNLRNARLQELKDLHERRRKYFEKGYGILTEVYSDKEFFETCKSADSIVVHFYRPTTIRCEYLDSHLVKLAQSHFDTKFIKVNVEKTPFICERFDIWCIPTLVILKNGKKGHSILGFDEFGGDGFSTSTLIKVLDKYGISNPI